MIVYEHGGRYSGATAAGVAFYSVSRIEAERALASMGIDPAALDTPADAVTWRSTLTQAFASELEEISSVLATLAPSSEVEEIQAKQAELQGHIVALNQQLAIEAIRIEVMRCEAEMDRQLPIMRQLMGAKAAESEIRAMVNHGPLGKRLAALMAEMRELAT